MYTLLSGYIDKESLTNAIVLDIFVTFRSFHGFRITVKVLLDCAVPIRGLEPVTLRTYSTSCCRSRKSIARSVTSLVRSSVAPVGSSNSTVKYPWSSLGMKLCGTRRPSMNIPTIATPKTANIRLELCTAKRTILA